ncbi:MAG: zf-HC2 domain-containing protein [Candidatus Eiseniibacteriota bacterium]|nr:MAG: zf-HC2 domain-containing protein [Candidatus Eisenbacteria bacterium]
MSHKSEDELLAYALEVIDDEEQRAGIEEHLDACPECRGQLESLKKDIELIGGLRPCRQPFNIPTPRLRESIAYSVLRAAAFVAIGFLVGVGASTRTQQREPVFLSASYVTLSPPAEELAAHAVSDATDISARYYEQVPEQSR